MHWEGLLRALGGAMVPEECFWYTIKFKWLHNKWMYLSQEQHPAKLTVQEQSRRQVTIPRLKPSKACRTLRVQLAPDGNNEEEANYLTQVTLAWGEIANCRLNHMALDYCL